MTKRKRRRLRPAKALLQLFKLKNDPMILQKLKSRKLIMAIVTGFLAIFGEQMGLSQVTQMAISVLSGTYVFGQGVADSGAQGLGFRTFTDKLKSRKLWMTIAGHLILVIGNYFEAPDLTNWIVTTFFGSYNVGQGIADAGNQGSDDV